jgi:hypothetical protein
MRSQGVRCTWRKRQLRPRISSREYSVSSRKLSDANTMGQSGSEGSLITKFCWMRSSVVARSRPARLRGTGGSATPLAAPTAPPSACTSVAA